MIEYATPSDLDNLVKWGKSFHQACPYGRLMPSSPDAIRRYLEWHIQSTSACIIRTKTGMIGGVLQPALDYLDGLVVRESFLWCSQPRDGLRLVSKLEYWARLRKADYIEMSTLCDGVGDSLGNILVKRRGYDPLQKIYRLNLKAD